MKSFNQFINENNGNDAQYQNTIDMLVSQDEIEQALGLQEIEHLYSKRDKEIVLNLLADRVGLDKDGLEYLNFIKDLGIVDETEYKSRRKNLLRSGVTSQEAFANTPIGIAMRSEPYRELMELGFSNASSVTQLTNGTLALEMPGKTRKLGIFQQGVIRRMLPPEERGIDAVVKRFDLDGAELYITALQWILDNIDFESSTFLTKKVTAAAVTSEQRKREVTEKIYGEFAKLGLSREDALVIMDGAEPWGLTNAKQIFSIVKKHAAKGIIPYFGRFRSYRSNEEAYDILSRPGIKWILIWDSAYISVFSDSARIWDNFDLDSHVSWVIANGGRYHPTEIKILFANEDQIDLYAPIFNNYEPVRGIRLTPKVSSEVN